MFFRRIFFNDSEKLSNRISALVRGQVDGLKYQTKYE